MSSFDCVRGWAGLFGDAGSIVTAAIAVWAAVTYKWRACDRRKRLEDYLREEKEKVTGDDKGQRSLLHLSARLGISESELVDISFRSKKIARRVTTNSSTGLADKLLLEYVGNGS